VRTIERYQPVFDEHAIPKPVVLENDAAPWVAALTELLEDRSAYDRESAAAHAASARFVSRLDAGDLERFLLALKPAAAANVSVSAAPATIESLSPEKRALLLQRLHQRRTAG
jgi:hypothetical protein